ASSIVRPPLTGWSSSQDPVRASRFVSPDPDTTGFPFRCERVGSRPSRRVTSSGSSLSPHTRRQIVARLGWPPHQTVSFGSAGGRVRGIPSSRLTRDFLRGNWAPPPGRGGKRPRMDARDGRPPLLLERHHHGPSGLNGQSEPSAFHGTD